NTESHQHGWLLSRNYYDKERIEQLKREISIGTYKDINGIVVIKDEALLIEEYFNGFQRDQLFDSRSVGKTLTSAILGIAIDEGYVKTVDQSIGEFYDLKLFANYSEKKELVTLENLLTMSSGFDGDDDDANSVG